MLGESETSEAHGTGGVPPIRAGTLAREGVHGTSGVPVNSGRNLS